MDGRMSEYWIHLDGVDQVRTQWQKEGKSIIFNKRQLTIASFLKVLSNTTTVDLPSLRWSSANDTFHSFTAANQFPDCYGLEYTYGITSTQAVFMARISALSQYISYYLSQDAPIPDGLVNACSELNTQLAAWSLDDEELPSLQGTDAVVQHIGGLHINAFAQGLRVHFHTRVLPCGASELAHHVQGVAESLNQIEEIKAVLGSRDLSGGSNKVTASLTWPGFIASCEADANSRDPWYEWWHSMLSKYRIGNIAQLWQVVKESWSLRDSGIREVPAWVPVLRRTGQRILAV